jgi:hypothetical protein
LDQGSCLPVCLRAQTPQSRNRTCDVRAI